MSVDNIKSILNVGQGPSQPCNFIVNIIPPASLFGGIDGLVGGVSISNLLTSRYLSLLAESAALPSRIISSTPHQINGTRREMPYGVLFDSMNITFICTNLMIERTFFDLWHRYIISPKSQYMNYYDNYVGTIVIQKTDNSNDFASIAGGLVSTYILEEAYPKTIQAQELSYSSTDEYLKLTVEFSYARFRTSLDWIADAAEKASTVKETIKEVVT